MKWHQDGSVTAQTQTELQVQALECCRTTVGGFMVSCLLAVTVVFCFTVKWQEMLNLNDEIQLSWTFIRPVALTVDYQSWLSVQGVKMEETGWLLYKRPSRRTILSEGRGFRTFPLKLDSAGLKSGCSFLLEEEALQFRVCRTGCDCKAMWCFTFKRKQKSISCSCKQVLWCVDWHLIVKGYRKQFPQWLRSIAKAPVSLIGGRLWFFISSHSRLKENSDIQTKVLY